MTVPIGIGGVTGQTGGRIRELAREREDISLAFGVASDERDGDPPVYTADGVETALQRHDPAVVVDFSAPAVTAVLAEAAGRAGVDLVVGTTGLDEAASDALAAASERVAVLQAANFSRGIQALLRALGPAIEALPGYDIELLETHHNRKRDAPSGTAGRLLEAVDEHREFETVAGREGVQPREDGEVGMLVRRAGDVRGEHEVMLAGNDEVLTLTHRAEDRAVFAAGALDAAVWLAGRDPGQYDFAEVVESG